MSDVDLGKTFDELFGKDERTDEQRASDALRRDRERNARAEEAFCRERDRRADYLAMDDRIRNLVANEIWKLVVAAGIAAAFYFAATHYGWLGVIAVAVLGIPVAWYIDREAQKDTTFKIHEIDDLAENTITHERIVALASQNQPWLPTARENPVFDSPFWSDVNERVRLYSRQSHKLRLADNAAARARSLPFRKAGLAEVREKNHEDYLPYWARVDSSELPS